MVAHAVNGYVTQLAGGQTEQRISAFLCHELSGVARCAGQLPATAGIKLHIVDERTGRDISKRQCVAGLDIRVSARLNSIAGLQARGSEDVALLGRLHTEAGRYGRNGSGRIRC